MNPHLDQVGDLVKSVKGDKQLLANLVQQGHVPHDIALLAGMRIDRLKAPQGNPNQPTVLQKEFAPQAQMPVQGLAQLAQPQAPQAQIPQQPAEQGLPGLATGGMFDEANYAGGGIVAFNDGGDVPGFASGAYMSSPVGRYFDPSQLTPYDDADIQAQLLRNPDKSIEQIREEQSKLREQYGIKNLAAEQRAELEKDTAENEKFKAQMLPMAGLKAAAALMSNQSQYFGPGAGAALGAFGTEYAAGQKEYKATAKDIRNMGFEIGRADQAMRQAEMSGDQALYNSERARRDALLKQAQDVKYKNIEQKNALITKGADAAAGYKTNVDVASIKEQGAAARAGATNKSDLYNKAADNALTQMKNMYPLGPSDPKFKQLAVAGGYATATDAYNAELDAYKKQNILGMAKERNMNPSEIVEAGATKPTDTAKPAAKNDTMAKPADTTVSGKIPKITNDAQYLKLKPGTEYEGPDGLRRRKPLK